MMDCNEATRKHSWWKRWTEYLLWDDHQWEFVNHTVYPNMYGESQTEFVCKLCGKHRIDVHAEGL
jgi:hypothetical protein